MNGSVHWNGQAAAHYGSVKASSEPVTASPMISHLIVIIIIIIGQGGDHSVTLMSRGGELIQRIYEEK
jgi:hypothetical protein